MPDLYKSKAWLRKRYHSDRKSMQEIADECGVTMKTIERYLKQYDLIVKRNK